MFPLLYTGLVARTSDATYHVLMYMRNATKSAVKACRSELSRAGYGSRSRSLPQELGASIDPDKQWQMIISPSPPYPRRFPYF